MTNELRGRPVGVVWVRKEELVYCQTNRWPPNLGGPAWFIYLGIGGAAPKPRLRTFPLTLLRIGNTHINQPFMPILSNPYSYVNIINLKSINLASAGYLLRRRVYFS